MRGFESMTVDEVASNAGVGKATVYRRWSRKEDLAVAAMEQLYRDEMPAADTGSIRGDLRAMFGSVLDLRELPGGHRLRAHHHQGVDARRPHRHALPRGQPARGAERRPRSSSAPSRAARCAATSPWPAAVQFLGGLVAMRAITGQDMPGLDELDELVDLVLHGISA